MNNNQNTVWILAFIIALVTLVLWFMGYFTPSDYVTQADLDAMGNGNAAPTAPVVAPTPPTPPAAPAAPAATTISISELEGFLETAYVSGNKDAKVSVIEFSDVECPFCQRHVNNGTLDQVNEKYGDDVNVIYAHFPLSFHPHAQKAGEAIECAGDIGGEEAFFTYKKALFAKGGKPTLDVVETVATEEGFEAEAFMACVNGGDFAQKVLDQMAFGRKMGVTGTPGNIVMNNETGEYQKVSGAVPATAFDPAIGQYLN